MLYRILKVYVRLAIRLYCHSINVNKPEMLKIKGPVLIASNHPNSFFDAIVYDILFDLPIWSLARGDVFKKFPKAIPFLKSVRIFPIYRTRDGAQSLSENYQTFDACMKVFEKNEAVTIFSEALCVNEWHLRPLRKGTARIAFMAWDKSLPVKVIPAGINYSSFRRYGKKIDVNFGEPIISTCFNLKDTDGNKNLTFNKVLKEQLDSIVYEIPKGDNTTYDHKFGIKPDALRRIVLFVPSLLAVLFHWPLYFTARSFTKKLMNNNDHYDSVMLAFLLFTYPAYLLLITLIAWLVTKNLWALTFLLISPITIISYVKSYVRKDRVFNC